MSKHFENKDALQHVMEKRAEGVTSISETHGTEMPGYLAAGTDAVKESALFLVMVWMLFSLFHIQNIFFLMAAGIGWMVWKGGRSGWLGWTRLERLHRVIEQEKYEIEHHRPQERQELVALYGAKGFSGKLLEDVVDVLMADQDRLLKVMLEEEMGLTLQAYEHPLQQTFGALSGAFVSLIVTITLFFLFPVQGGWISILLLFSASAILSAKYERNRVISAVIWNLSIGILSLGVTYFLAKLTI